jgi:hypothetical protein
VSLNNLLREYSLCLGLSFDDKLDQ